jgi:hypothetical protein
MAATTRKKRRPAAVTARKRRGCNTTKEGEKKIGGGARLSFVFCFEGYAIQRNTEVSRSELLVSARRRNEYLTVLSDVSIS